MRFPSPQMSSSALRSQTSLARGRSTYSPGSALLVCTTMSHDVTGRLVEIGEITYRADLYQLHTKLVRAGQRPADQPRPRRSSG